MPVLSLLVRTCGRFGYRLVSDGETFWASTNSNSYSMAYANTCTTVTMRPRQRGKAIECCADWSKGKTLRLIPFKGMPACSKMHGHPTCSNGKTCWRSRSKGKLKATQREQNRPPAAILARCDALAVNRVGWADFDHGTKIADPTGHPLSPRTAWRNEQRRSARYELASQQIATLFERLVGT
jgi:hypothetical protein